ncbi:hypothetical protein [Streptomyces pseudovenezuelae]|uniref:hypothetical protein n=1 Tax=Streptomyces pseudovenezuelae TaxID=67350 RepID=UPI002E373EE9|nr:hypothetical protein [Streptomyces pseudovenezuelae]
MIKIRPRAPNLDIGGRRRPMKGNGPRSTTRRSQARAYFVRENACWDAGTARLLLRLPRGRAQGPVFVTHRRLARGR